MEGKEWLYCIAPYMVQHLTGVSMPAVISDCRNYESLESATTCLHNDVCIKLCVHRACHLFYIVYTFKIKYKHNYYCISLRVHMLHS